jgi:hypothetical protein
VLNQDPLLLRLTPNSLSQEALIEVTVIPRLPLALSLHGHSFPMKYQPSTSVNVWTLKSQKKYSDILKKVNSSGFWWSRQLLVSVFIEIHPVIGMNQEISHPHHPAPG